MSWSNWSEQGYGFKLFNGKNDMQVLQFIRSNSRHKISDQDAKDLINVEASYDDIYGESACVLIAGIINEQEGYTVFTGYPECGNTDQEEMIGVYLSYPWNLTEKDWTLTKEKARMILKKYANILGIKEEPKYFDAYYAG